MELSEVQEYLTTNKDSEGVKTYLESFKVQPSLEVFKNKLNDADFKSFMDSEKDKHLTKGLETFKTNNLDRIYTERFNVENPTADPKEIANNKKMADFEAKIANMEKEGIRKDLTSKSQKIAIEKKLPLDLVDFFIGENEEVTVKNLDKLEAIFASHVETLVTERLKGNSYTPPKGTGGATGITKESFATMSYKEKLKMYTENPEQYKELSK